jgi:hypothetical protein
MAFDNNDPGGGDDARRLAIDLLARELHCTPADIVIVELSPVTWPNSALGCPKPGMMYLQVLTPGYRVRLAHGKHEYIVHTDRGHRAIRCPQGGILPTSTTE